MSDVIRYIIMFYLACGLGVLVLIHLPARRQKPLGPREFTGSVTAAIDSLNDPEFAHNFALATSEFEDWFLTGYRKALSCTSSGS